ncbi:MAG: hypothetical protein QG555_783 [Thermodesulfobacteriota bacterium]|nr:hypothetical protein [Thermodesulfobacteriota bacterium]
MPDPVRHSYLHGFTDMALQTLGGNHPQYQLAGMEGELNPWKALIQKAKHLHME